MAGSVAKLERLDVRGVEARISHLNHDYDQDDDIDDDVDQNKDGI